MANQQNLQQHIAQAALALVGAAGAQTNVAELQQQINNLLQPLQQIAILKMPLKLKKSTRTLLPFLHYLVTATSWSGLSASWCERTLTAGMNSSAFSVFLHTSPAKPTSSSAVSSPVKESLSRTCVGTCSPSTILKKPVTLRRWNLNTASTSRAIRSKRTPITSNVNSIRLCQNSVELPKHRFKLRC